MHFHAPGRTLKRRCPTNRRRYTGLAATIWVALLGLAVIAPPAAAQGSQEPALIGVIASRTGGASGPGAAQWLLASNMASGLRASGGVFGVSVQFDLRDDASTPATARAQARELIDSGALLIVCCTTPLASREVAEVAEAAGVPLLTPTTFESSSPHPYWAFALAADDTDALAAIVADAYRENRPSLALMALEGSVGNRAATDLEALLAVIGAGMTHKELYRPGISELRPEALLVAASQPGGVVVWGLADDLLVAHDALRRRGYEGNVYLRTALLAPGSTPLPWTRLLNARVAVPPAAAAVAPRQAVANLATPQHGVWGSGGACAAAGHNDAQRLEEVPGGSAHAVATAPFLAALDLLEAGLEQLIALQIPSSNPAVLRQALRDTLVGLPAFCTGAGLIDLRDGVSNGIDPGGLAIAVVTSRGLAPLTQ